MSFFSNLQNIFKRRESLIKEKSYTIRDSFNMVRSLLRNSVIDFSLIKYLLSCVEQEIDKEESKEEQRLIIVVFRKYMKYLFTELYNLFKDEKEKCLSDYYFCVNSVNFLLFILINYPDSYSMISILFEQKCNFLDYFHKCLLLSLSFRDQYDIIKTITNFYSSQFLTLFSDSGVIDLYQILKDKLIKITINNYDYKKFSPSDYKILLKHLLVLNFNFKNALEDSKICTYQDKPLGKLIKILK